MGLSIFGQIPTTGLISHYPMDGSADDITKNQNHGTLSGPITAKDRFGVENSSYFFDGINDYINFGSDTSLMPSSITINMWVKFEDNQRNMFLMNNVLPGPGTWGVTTFYAKDGTGWRTTGGGGLNNKVLAIKSNLNVDTSKWQMYTMTYSKDSNSLKLFIDGKFIAKENYGGTVGSFGPNDSLQHDKNTNWYFGLHNERKKQSLDPYYFKGFLDDMRIYNRALTNSEISQLFINSQSTSLTAPNTNFSKLLIYPNPTNSQIRLKGIGDGIVDVYDIKGSLIKTISFKDDVMFDTELPRGEYIFRIKSRNNNFISRKVLIK
jgi:hypothetical protein